MKTKNIIGCVLMVMAIIGASIAFFALHWTLGVIFSSYIIYRIGYFLNEPRIKLNL